MDEVGAGAEDEQGEALFRALLERCEAELERTTDHASSARLLHACGLIYEERLGDPRRAAECYLEVHRLVPAYLPNVRAARRLMQERGDWAGALELVDAELHVTSAADQKAELYVERGRILEDRLGSADRARQAYARAFELDDRNPDAWRLLSRALASEGRWSELDDVYARVAVLAVEPEARAALMVLRGRIHDEKLAQPAVASQLFEQALEVGGSPPAHAVVALKRLHAAAGRWTDLVGVLGLEAGLLDEPGEALCHYRIARVYADRLGRLDKALEHLERVERLVPASVLALTELGQIYEQTGRFHDLARVCLRQLELTTEPAERLSLHQKLGQICEEHLEDDLGAMEHLRRAVELRPGYVPALQALGKLCRKNGAWEQLLEMHRIEAEQAPEAQRRALAHYRAGEVLETQLGRPDEAVDQYRRAQQVVPSFLPALRALDRLYSRLGRWRELIALYETEGESFRGRRPSEASGEDALRLARIEQIGSVYEDKIGDLDQAAESFRRVLEIEPGHVGAITALERIYEKAERWTELMDILEREAELVEDEAWVAALLHKVGEIAEERLGDRHLALLHYRRVLAVNPSYVPALTSLGRMYYQQGRWVDLLGMYRKEAEVASRLEDRIPILFKMGELFEEKEAKEEEAESCYRQCLELDPAFSPALRSLERIYRRRRDWERLAEVLEAQAAEIRDPFAKAVAHQRVAELYEERLGRENLARDAYRRALASDERFEPARDALSRLAAARGEWGELSAIFEEQLALSARGYRRLELLVELARLRLDRLESPEGAAAALDEILALAPWEVGAALELVDLARRRGEWERLAEGSRRLAAATPDLLVRAGALRELGLTLQERLAPGLAASEAWERLLELRPTDSVALRALERSARSRGDRTALARVIRLQIERAGDPQVDAALRLALAILLEAAGKPADALAELRKVILIEPDSSVALEGARRLARRVGDLEAELHMARRLAEIPGEPWRKALGLVEAATALEGSAAAPAEVVAVAEKALEVDPSSVEAAALLERILTGAGEFERLRAQLGRAAARAQEPARALALHLAVAALCRDRLSDPAGAVVALEKALRLEPDSSPLLDSLCELYPEVGRWEEALALCERLVEASSDLAVVNAARLRQARLLEERASDLEKVAEVLGKVVETDPTSREALRRLGAVRARQREWTEAIVVLERLVELETEPARRVEVLTALAGVHAEGTGESERVLELLGRALAEGASLEQVRTVLETAFDSGEELEVLGAAYGRLVDSAAPEAVPDAVDGLELALGALLADRLGRPEEAAARYRSVLARSPGRLEARSRLAELYSRLPGRDEDAVREHRAVLAADPFALESIRSLHRLWSEGGQADRAALSARALDCLGQARPAEARLERDRPGSTTEPLRKIARPALRTRLLPTPAPALAAALLEALEPAFAKLLPPDCSRHGVASGEAPLGTKSPLGRRAASICRLFGLDAVQLHLSSSLGSLRGEVEPTEPPSVVVPAEVEALPAGQQAFVLGEAMSQLALGTWPVTRLGAVGLEALLAAAVRLHDEDFAAGGAAAEQVEDWRSRLDRAMPRRRGARRALAGPAGAYAERPAPEFGAWVASVRTAGLRAGLLASGELDAALEVVGSRRTGRPAGAEAEDRVAFWRGLAAARELCLWYLSDEHFVLRRMAGLGPVAPTPVPERAAR